MDNTKRGYAAASCQIAGNVVLSPQRREWAEHNVDPAMQAMLEEDARYFLHQSPSTPCLAVVKKAEGIWIEDTAGRRYMDFHGNSVHHIGYGHPRLIQAIKQQLDDMPFAPRRYTNEPAIALARKLAEITPGHLGKVLFAPSGSDAVEMAMKTARYATGRFKTVSFWNSFHGAGFGASSVGGRDMYRSHGVGPLLPGTEHVETPACYRCPYGYNDIDGKPDFESCHMVCADLVCNVLEREGDVAAVIAEPMRATPEPPPPGFWKAVRESCDKHGALLIFDEIPTGLGKTGTMFACEQDDVVPDILVIGKSLGGGVVPIAAMIAKPELDVAGALSLGHYTHEKSPIASRAALTTIEIIEEEELVENARRMGERALERLQDMKDRHPLIGNVRGRGLMIGIELVLDRDTKEKAVEETEAIMYFALEKGLSFKSMMKNVVTLSPPLVITEHEMDKALKIIDECLTEVESGA